MTHNHNHNDDEAYAAVHVADNASTSFTVGSAQVHADDIHELGDRDGIHLPSAHEAPGDARGHMAWPVRSDLARSPCPVRERDSHIL